MENYKKQKEQPTIDSREVDVLKIEEKSWGKAVKKALSKKRPKEGWPEKEDLRKRKKK